MIGRHPNIQKGWVHRARKGTVALVFATAIGTLSGLALNPQPAHASKPQASGHRIDYRFGRVQALGAG